MDLATDAGVDELYGKLEGRKVDALALNAGIGAGGAFATDTALERRAQADRPQRALDGAPGQARVKDMVDRDEGRILFTSSIASTMPGAFQAVYNASKSFVQSFALALRNELKDTNVTVTSLMPGPTDTEFFERADMEDTKVGSGDKDDPAEVAKDGFEALMAGKERVVSASLSTKLQGRGSRVMPDRSRPRCTARWPSRGRATSDAAARARSFLPWRRPSPTTGTRSVCCCAPEPATGRSSRCG